MRYNVYETHTWHADMINQWGRSQGNELTVNGVYYLMNEANFFNNIEPSGNPHYAIPRLLAEMRHDGLPPMFMKIN